MNLRICWLVILMTSKPQFAGEKVKLSDLCSKGKSSLRQKDLLNDGPYLVYGASGVIGTMSCYQNEEPYVAVVKDGAGVGRVMACKGKSSVLGTMQALLPSKNVDLNYLLHLVRSLKLGDDFSGSTIPHIYFRDYGEREVPAIAIKQQIMIAGVLDKIEMMLARLDMTLKKQDQLVKSRFVEMFGDPTKNQKSWEFGTVESLSINLDSRRVPITQADRVPGPYPYYGASGIVDYVADFIFEEPLLLISEDGANLLARTLPIAFSICGKTWVNNHAHILKCHNEAGRIYLETLINMLDISSYVTGSAQPKLNQKQLNSIPIMLPPLELQQEFADFVAQVDKSGFA